MVYSEPKLARLTRGVAGGREESCYKYVIVFWFSSPSQGASEGGTCQVKGCDCWEEGVPVSNLPKGALCDRRGPM